MVAKFKPLPLPLVTVNLIHIAVRIGMIITAAGSSIVRFIAVASK